MNNHEIGRALNNEVVSKTLMPASLRNMGTPRKFSDTLFAKTVWRSCCQKGGK